MQISATSSIPPITAIDRYATTAQVQVPAKSNGIATGRAIEELPTKKPFVPAPPLRPNVQDYVDIDRTLMMLRGL